MKDIIPNITIDEVLKNAKKCSIGIFYKQYNKGDFVFTVNKPPFRSRVVLALHKPTKILFNYSPIFQDWEKLDKTFDEFSGE